MNTADVAAITTHGRQPPRRNRSRMTTQMPLRQMIGDVLRECVGHALAEQRLLAFEQELLVAQRAHPIGINVPMLRAALAARDDPIGIRPGLVQRDRSQQRFAA